MFVIMDNFRRYPYLSIAFQNLAPLVFISSIPAAKSPVKALRPLSRRAKRRDLDRRFSGVMGAAISRRENGFSAVEK